MPIPAIFLSLALINVRPGVTLVKVLLEGQEPIEQVFPCGPCEANTQIRALTRLFNFYHRLSR